MEIIVRAQDQASRIFTQVSAASKAAQRDINSYGNGANSSAKKAEQGMGRAAKATETLRNNTERLKNIDLSKFDNAWKKTGDTATKTFNRIRGGIQALRAETEDDINLGIKADGIEETLGALSGAHAAAHGMFANDIGVTLKPDGIFRTLKAMGLVAARAERLEARQFTIKVATKGARRALNSLMGLENKAIDLDMKRIAVDLGVRGVRIAIRRMFQLQKVGEDLEGNPVTIPVGLAEWKKVKERLKDLRRDVDETSAKDVGIDIAMQGYNFVKKQIEDIVAQINHASSQDIDIDADVDAKDAFATFGMLDRESNRISSKPTWLNIKTVGAAIAAAKLMGLDKQKKNLSTKAAKIYFAMQGYRMVKGAFGDLFRNISLIGKTPAQVRAQANTEEANQKLDELQDKIRLLSAMEADPSVDLKEKEKVQAEIAQLEAELNDLDSTKSSPEVGIDGANRVRGILSGLKSNFGEVDGIKAMPAVAIVGAALALKKLRSVRQAARETDDADAEVNVSAEGDEWTERKLVRIEHLSNRLDGRRIRLDLDAKGAILLPRLLGDSLHTLTSFETVMAGVAAIKVPAFVAALGGASTALLSLGGAAGSAAIALGQGVAGSLGAVGTAAGLSGAALVTYHTALRKTYEYATDLTNSLYHQHSEIKQSNEVLKQAEAQLGKYAQGTAAYARAANGVTMAQQNANFEQEKYAALMEQATPAMISLQAASHAWQLNLIRIGGTIAQIIAPSMEMWIRRATELATEFGPAVRIMSEDMNEVANSFLKAATSGERLHRIRIIIGSVMEAGAPALKTLTNLANIFIDTLSIMAPSGLAVVRVLDRATTSASRWADSAEGQARIAEIWGLLERRAQGLWAGLRNLGEAFVNIGKSLAASGLVGDMALGFVKATQAIRDFTREGSRGRQMMDEFWQASKPILSEMGLLFVDLAREAFRVAHAIGVAGQSHGEINPLVAVIRGLRNAISPIGKLIEENMIIMGPKIGELIPYVAKLAQVFLYAWEPLQIFLDGINLVLGAFTKLDPTLQHIIASGTAWIFTFGTLGLTMSKVGRIVSGPFVGAWNMLAAVFGPVWTAIKRVGGALGRFISIAGRVALAITPFSGLLTPVIGLFAALSPPVWLAVAAIGALVVAGSGLITHWDKVKAYFTGDGAKTFDATIQKARAFGRALLNRVLKAANQVVSWFKKNWPAIREVIVQVANEIWSTAWPLMGQIFSSILRAVRHVVNWFKKNWPTIKKLAIDLAQGLKNNVWPIIKAFLAFFLKQFKYIVDWFTKNWPLIARTVKQVADFIWATLKFLVNQVVRPIVTRIVNLWDDGNGRLAKIAKSIWNIIKSTIQTTIRNVLSIIKVVLHLINGEWGAAWDEIKAILKRTLDHIVTIAKNLLNILWEVIKGVLNWIWERFKLRFRQVKDFVKNIFGEIVGEAKTFIGFYKDALSWIWKKMPQTLRDAMGRAAEGMKKKLLRGVNAVRRVLGALLGAVGNVLRAIGADGLADSVKGRAAKLKEPIKMARGGVVKPQGPEGGVADGHTPRVVYGEVRKKETYAVHGRKDNLPYAQQYLDSVGYKAVPKQDDAFPAGFRPAPRDTWAQRHYSAEPNGSAYARQHPTHYNVRPAVKSRVNQILDQFPGTYWNTYRGHPGGDANSVDFWGKRRGDPIGPKGTDISNFITQKLWKGLNWIIWNRKINSGGGWRQHTGPFSHTDHVHATWLDNGGGFGGPGGGAPSGKGVPTGGGGFDWMAKIRKGMKNIRKHARRLGNTGMGDISKGMGEWGKAIPGKIRKWLIKQAKKIWGSLGPVKGGDVESNVKLGKMMNERAGWGQHWDSLRELWRRESRWDHTAENKKSGAYGIPQRMPGVHGKITDFWKKSPRAQIAWGIDYISGRHGNPTKALRHHDRHNWYSKGGVVPGPKGMPKVIGAHAGERVLPLSVVDAFERMTSTIKRWRDQQIQAPGTRVSNETRANRTHRRRSQQQAPGRRVAGQVKVGDINITINEADKKQTKQIMDEIGDEIERRIRKVMKDTDNDAAGMADRISMGDLIGF